MRRLVRLLACSALAACGQAAGAPAGAFSIDPACASSLASIPSPVILPAGVTADPRPREQVIEAAGAWDLPSGVTFSIAGPPVLAGDRLTLRGEIVNATDAPQTVMLSEAGAGYFSATLVHSSLVRRPMPAPQPGVAPPPVLFPEPHAYTLAPGARWPLETTVVVSCWEPAPGRTVALHWWLNVEGESADGEVPITLGAAP